MKNLLFDLDGTLMETWPGIRVTLRATLEDLGLEPDRAPLDRSLVGMPLARVFERLLPGDAEAAREATVHYREIFPLVGLPEVAPFPGIGDLLERLRKRGRSLFVVTARNEVITRQMLLEHGLADFFSSVRGEKEGEVPDGKGAMVGEVMERFTLQAAATVMIGDRRYDMEAAADNGIGSIGVTYGYGSAGELQAAEAGRLVESVGELAAVLLADR